MKKLILALTLATVLTLPIIYPMISAYSCDPIWFGVTMVILLEIGLITPPVGMNVFIIHGIARGSRLEDIFKGVLPYVVINLAMIGLLVVYPDLALWPPRLAFY